MDYTYSAADVLNVYLPLNINRTVARTVRTNGMHQRPNFSIRLSDWLVSIIGQDPDVQTEIINLTSAGDNIYNTSDTLTDNRIVTGEDKTLDWNFAQGARSSSINWDGTNLEQHITSTSGFETDFFMGTDGSYLRTTSAAGANQNSVVCNTANVDIGSSTGSFTDRSNITVAPTSVDFTLVNSRLELNGDPGTTGQVITSGGPAGTNTWTTPSGSSSNIYTADGTLTGNRTLTGAGSFLTVDMSTGTDTFVESWFPATNSKITAIVTDGGNTQSRERQGEGTWEARINDFTNGDTTYFQADVSDVAMIADNGSTQSSYKANHLEGLEINVGTGKDLRINGSAGNIGDVITSQGTGANPVWAQPTGIIYLETNVSASIPAQSTFMVVSGGGATVTLPALSIVANGTLFVVKSTAGSNITVATADASTIDAAATATIAPLGSLNIRKGNTAYYIV